MVMVLGLVTASESQPLMMEESELLNASYVPVSCDLQLPSREPLRTSQVSRGAGGAPRVQLLW